MDEVLLNEKQKEAVFYEGGPLLIIAGAGTGKTAVVTKRVENLIKKGVSPSKILALTFTEKAASEMEGRIDQALPLGYSQLSVFTFHGFCDFVLRESGFHIGLNPDFRVMSSPESVGFFTKHLFGMPLELFRPLGSPTKFVNMMLSHFSRLSDEGVTPKHYSQHVEQIKEIQEGEKWQKKEYLELARVWEFYDSLKRKESRFDFSDLIIFTIELFKKRPNVLLSYQKRFPYLLVDEYQDTNKSQHELITLLAGNSGQITAVCDDDQSIYGFRGASISNVLGFTKSFAKTHIVTLNENYRSYQEILDSSYKLISHNNPKRLEYTEKIDKKLKASRGEGGVTEFYQATNSAEEVDFVLDKILSQVGEGKYNYSDFAILVRANSHADSFVRAFKRQNIPFEYLGPGKLFDRDEVVDLISYLRVLVNVFDSQSWYRVVTSEALKLDIEEVATLFARAKEDSEPVWNKIRESDNQNIQKLTSLFKPHLKALRNTPAVKIILEYLETFGITQNFYKEQTIEEVEKTENITKFLTKLMKMEEVGISLVPDVLSHIDMLLYAGDSPSATEVEWQASDAVRIITIHSSKGLEFPVVFVVNLVSQRFPSIARQEGILVPPGIFDSDEADEHILSERRLMYVAMTRAKDQLYLTASKFYEGAIREKKISNFVLEAGFSESVKHSHKNLAPVVAGAILKPEEFKVTHLSYSQIETFKLCPLHYKLRYILKVPTPQNAASSFGNSFHRIMRAFYVLTPEEREDPLKTMDELINLHWIKTGYLSHDHERASKEKIKEHLNFFVKNWFSEDGATIDTEVPFSFKIDGLKITGIIDRLDEKDGCLHIIDYKTGSSPMSQKEADKSLQLSLYALAATTIPEAPFARSPEKVKLTLLYFDKTVEVVTTRTKAQLEEAKNEILSYKKQIEESDFPCSLHPICEHCEYSVFCRAAKNTS